MWSNKASDIIRRHAASYVSIFDFDLKETDTCVLDFSNQNKALSSTVILNAKNQAMYVDQVLASMGAKVGVGGYLEKRVIYQRGEIFTEEKEARDIHLGLDLWTNAFTAIHAPLDGKIYSIKDNKGVGNYGPTVILKHQLETLEFYTLYGHLDHDVLSNYKVGDSVKKGTTFCRIGNYPGNGDWAPHLHFQLMVDISDFSDGDYPGVCSEGRKAWFSSVCLDPNVILNITKLHN